MSKKMNFKRVLLCALFLIASAINVPSYINVLSLVHATNVNSINTECVNDSVKPTVDTQVIEDVIDAIIYVESIGKLNAVNGSCCGPMQISPGMVKACNNILKERGDKKMFNLNDRFNLEKSKEMFRLFNEKYNPTFDMNKAIRSWNGGLGYRTASTQSYYNKVMERYNLIHNAKK